MTKNFKMKTGDLEPSIELELFPTDFDLAGKQAFFNMRDLHTGVVKVNDGVMTITNPSSPPTALYQWVDGDTDTPGVYEVEVRVIGAGNRPETFPSERDKNVRVIIGQSI